MLGEALLLHVLESAAFHAVRRGYLRLRFINCSLINPSRDIRIAFSALASIRDGVNFLLVRNLHRPESFGPFGGVFKFTDHSLLDQLEFKPEAGGTDSDLQNDLRGYLPRKNLASLVSWFQKKTGRESPDECLRRELCEEIAEIDLSRRLKCPEILPVLPIRSVQEGPGPIPGEAYTQYRIFEVYEPDVGKSSINAFCNRLLKKARAGHRDLMLASAQEIISGRSNSGSVIGHHAGYLLGRKKIRPESPMFKTH